MDGRLSENREARIEFLLEVEAHAWDRATFPPDLQQLWNACGVEDFALAIAVLEAAMIAPAKQFVGTGLYSFYRTSFNRLNALPSDLPRLWRQQEEGRREFLEVGLRLEALRDEAQRRWPEHPHHGHWWRHDASRD